jgi:hypothetical protein
LHLLERCIAMRDYWSDVYLALLNQTQRLSIDGGAPVMGKSSRGADRSHQRRAKLPAWARRALEAGRRRRARSPSSWRPPKPVQTLSVKHSRDFTSLAHRLFLVRVRCPWCLTDRYHAVRRIDSSSRVLLLQAELTAGHRQRA